MLVFNLTSLIQFFHLTSSFEELCRSCQTQSLHEFCQLHLHHVQRPHTQGSQSGPASQASVICASTWSRVGQAALCRDQPAHRAGCHSSHCQQHLLVWALTVSVGIEGIYPFSYFIGEAKLSRFTQKICDKEEKLRATSSVSAVPKPWVKPTNTTLKRDFKKDFRSYFFISACSST